jgi:SAM-dependent methyltransferase
MKPHRLADRDFPVRPGYGGSRVARAYDEIGRGYREIRRPDPRLAAAIDRELGDARSVVNVGAGAGSYEPGDRDVLAVEPSAVMLAQRPPGAAPAIRARAEALPLAGDSFDAALAVLTIQHWSDVERGIAELCRVARRRVVVVTMDVGVLAELWLVREYVPETLAAHAAAFPSIERLVRLLANARVTALPVPRDCSDGFMAAYWGRPEAYLDPRVRAATSPWHELPGDVVERAVAALRADLESGRWDTRHGALRRSAALDVGLRLVAADPGHRAMMRR